MYQHSCCTSDAWIEDHILSGTKDKNVFTKTIFSFIKKIVAFVLFLTPHCVNIVVFGKYGQTHIFSRWGHTGAHDVTGPDLQRSGPPMHIYLNTVPHTHVLIDTGPSYLQHDKKIFI